MFVPLCRRVVYYLVSSPCGARELDADSLAKSARALERCSLLNAGGSFTVFLSISD